MLPPPHSGSGGSAHSSTHDGGGGSVHLGASTGSATASNYAVNNSSLICRNRQMRFARSQTVALRMSTTHVLAFVGCWTPYLVISAWHIVDPEGVGKDVSPEVQDALFLTAVFNSCINPLVYGGFYFRYVLCRSVIQMMLWLVHAISGHVANKPIVHNAVMHSCAFVVFNIQTLAFTACCPCRRKIAVLSEANGKLRGMAG